MQSCSVVKNLKVVPGFRSDYQKLARFHYRDSHLGVYAAIFKLQVEHGCSKITAGVIVYTMPTVGLELRNIATGKIFTGLDRATGLSLINKNIRCINRVIIEPRFRGLGLAVRLVQKTMPLMKTPIIEALAVMGGVNPFFAKAGMKTYTAGQPARCAQLIEALSLVGIEEKHLVEVRKVHRKLQRLHGRKARFVESQIRRFLQSYGKRRLLQPGLERTQFVLSKLTARPVYYIWFNPEMELLTD